MSNFDVDFSPIANLGKTYKDAQNERTLADLGKGLASGQLDYKQAAGIAAEAGKTEMSLALLALGEKKAQQDDYTKTFAPYLTGGIQPGQQPQPSMSAPGAVPQSPTPSSSGPRPPPPQVLPGMLPAAFNPEDGTTAPPRAPIAGNAKVWGDNEPGNPYGNPPTQQVAGGPQGPQAPSAPVAPALMAPQGPQARTNPFQGGNVGRLMAAMMHPGASEGQRRTAEIALSEAIKTPDGLKEYQFYADQARARGEQPKPYPHPIELKQAGATLINTAPGMDAAQAKARIDIDTHAIQDLSKKVASGRAAIPLLDQMVALSAKTPGGWTGAVSPFVAKGMASIGIEVPEGISNAELFNSISRQFIPAVRDPGSTSNYEQSLYAQAVPSLSQSPEGRVKIAGMMKAQLQRQAEIMQIYRQNVGSPDLDKKLMELDAKPVFAPADRKLLETIPKAPANGAGGQGRVAPDGKTYIDDPNRPGKYLRVD